MRGSRGMGMGSGPLPSKIRISQMENVEPHLTPPGTLENYKFSLKIRFFCHLSLDPTHWIRVCDFILNIFFYKVHIRSGSLREMGQWKM